MARLVLALTLTLAWGAPVQGFQSSRATCRLRLPAAWPGRRGSASVELAASSQEGGVTLIRGEKEYANKVGEGSIGEDGLVAIKFFAPWCRACKGLEPKYKRIAQQYPDFEFLEMNWEDNRVFAKTIGVQALPMVKMFTADGEVESFACGPKKVELLRSKLDAWKNKLSSDDAGDAVAAAVAGAMEKARSEAGPSASSSAVEVEAEPGGAMLPENALRQLCTPLFGNLTETQLQALLSKAVVATFRDGDILMEQGDTGRRLFVMLSGEVEIFQNRGYGVLADRTPWGTPVNSLGPGQYFGEHALLTGQPRWATVAAVSSEVRCLTIEKSVLEAVDPDRWLQTSSFTPSVWGIEAGKTDAAPPLADPDKLVSKLGFGVPDSEQNDTTTGSSSKVPMLVRFKLLRNALRAFDQAQKRTPNWGDAEQMAFRKALVSQLTDAQLEEFKTTFTLFDRDADGQVEAWELAQPFRTLKGEMTEAELLDVINKANPNVDGNTLLTEDDFIAMMAEHEYTEFFLEAFSTLDEKNDGWVSSQRIFALLRELTSEGDVVMSDKQIRQMLYQFGMDDTDGHVDYKAFVSLLMSTTVANA